MATFNNANPIAGKGKLVMWLAGGFAAFIFVMILNPFVIVGPGERGIVLNFGAVQPAVLGEGLHLRVPIMQTVVLMDVKVQKAQTEADAASKDLQDTHSTVALNYHVQPEAANIVYRPSVFPMPTG